MAVDSLKSPALDAVVKGRVPQAYVTALDAEVRKRRSQFPRASRGDVMRDALAEYFKNHPLKPVAGAGNGRDNGR